MPHPDLVVIDSTSDGIFLLRRTIWGDFAGDTWHPSAESAKEQARLEYGDLEWLPIPDEEVDAVTYATAAARRTPTFRQFTEFMSNQRPDDKDWIWFWSDIHEGLAHRNYPGFWKDIQSRHPDGDIRQVVEAWPVDELKRVWKDHVYGRR